MGGVLGVLIAGYAGSGNVSLGNPYLFEGLAAVIVGGTAFGARGNYWKTVIGALVLTVLSTVLLGKGYSNADEQMVYGVITLAVVGGYGRDSRLRDHICGVGGADLPCTGWLSAVRAVTASGDGDAFALGGFQDFVIEGRERGTGVFRGGQAVTAGEVEGWRCRSRAASTAIASLGWWTVTPRAAIARRAVASPPSVR